MYIFFGFEFLANEESIFQKKKNRIKISSMFKNQQMSDYS